MFISVSIWWEQGYQGCLSTCIQDHSPTAPKYILPIIIFCPNGNCSNPVLLLLISQFCYAFISVWLWSIKGLATEGYVLCRPFKILSSFVLFRFLHSLAIMHIILTVKNVIKLKWNIYTVPFAENFGLGKWMCVSDILQHMRVWFIDIWWLCWHQCIYLKKSCSLYKCKWEMAFHLFPRWK